MTDYSSEDFWKGAPETSTHYQPPRGEGFNPVFWRVENGVPVEAWAVLENGDLRHVPKPSYIDDVFGRLIPRPTPPWSGDGLPPVGTAVDCKCTAKTKARDWFPAEVKYISPYTVVLVDYSTDELDGEFVAHPATLTLRPRRTPAQIAADEREAAAKAMRAIVTRTHPAECPYLTLYDAGYRLTKGDGD